MDDEEELRGEKRRTPPLGVKLEAALRQIVDLWKLLGRVPAEMQFEEMKLDCDHNPALGRRRIEEKTRKYIPDQHDPKFLEFLWRPDHKTKTSGNGATTRGSDIGEISKTKRLVKKRKARERAAAIEAGEEPPPLARTPPKRQWAKRKFPSGHRPMRGRNNLRKQENHRDR